ncbi:MAG: glycosyltransferase family 2 protein [Bacteroidetes bacterium]|nr:glycosyltransferase family 2 protein [Bacteroidota bacterium]
MKTYLFIIPLTPKIKLCELRLKLREICFNTLLKQTYTNWIAICCGNNTDAIPSDGRIIHIPYAGPKEEKLQIISDYIVKNNVPGDYVIRLDDDDIFNPSLLERICKLDFDIYVDKYQSFIDVEINVIAQKIMYWFPNTCIIKRELALQVAGNFPPGEHKTFRERAYFIENQHHDFHKLIDEKTNVLFADKKHPIYLRTINESSISAKASNSFSSYFLSFGFWRENNLLDFKEVVEKKSLKIKQTLAHRLNCIKNNLLALKSYNKLVIKKNKK